MATAKENELGQQLNDLVQSLMPTFSVSGGQIRFTDTNGRTAVVQVSQMSQKISSRSIAGG